MTTSDPHGRHDWHSRPYVDEWITSAAQRDEERRIVLRRLVSLIPRDIAAAIRVLDVGAGYGALSAQVLELFPQAELVCQDFSEPMFVHARERLAWAAERVSFAPSDLGTPSWTTELAGPFDAVVSSIAIHNVRYPERIRAIYTEISGLVGPGGCFLNCDLIFASGRSATAAYSRTRRLGGWIQAPRGEERSPPAADLEAHERRGDEQPWPAHAGAERSTQQVERATLEDQLRWLREAGFQDVECFWKEGQSAIIGGFQPAAA